MLLSGMLTLAGIAITVRSFVIEGDPVKQFTLKGLLFVVGASILFGVFIRELGLAVSVFAVVLISAAASVHFRIATALALAVGLSLFCILLFVTALGLPIPLLGPWLGG
jgi:hypothetical protein